MEEQSGQKTPILQDPTESYFTEKLISLVSKYPELYDKRAQNYNDKQARDLVWMGIADEMNVDCDVVLKRWKNIRDAYGRSLVGQKGQRKLYRYARQMKFLKNHLWPRKTRHDMTSDNGDSDERWQRHDTSETLGKRKRTSPKRYNPSIGACMTTRSSSPTISAPVPTRDEDELWLLSLAPTLKRLNDFQKGLAKIKIHQCLLDLEFGKNHASVDISTNSPNQSEVNQQSYNSVATSNLNTGSNSSVFPCMTTDTANNPV